MSDEHRDKPGCDSWVLRLIEEQDRRFQAVLKERDDRYRAEAAAIEKALSVANEHNAHWKRLADDAMRRLEQDRREFMPKIIANIYLIAITIGTVVSIYLSVARHG